MSAATSGRRERGGAHDVYARRFSPDERAAMGSRVRAARWASGLSRPKVAHRVGVSPQAVEQWEHGSFPAQQFRASLAEVLEVDEAVLFAEYEAKRAADGSLLRQPRPDRVAGRPGVARRRRRDNVIRDDQGRPLAYPVHQVAERLGVCDATVYYRIHRGQLATVPHLRPIRVAADVLRSGGYARQVTVTPATSRATTTPAPARAATRSTRSPNRPESDRI